MKYRHLIFLFVPFLIIFSCKKDGLEKNNDGVIIYVSYDWNYEISDNSFNNSIIRGHLIKDNEIYLATVNNGSYFLSKVSISNGELKWKWNDVYQYGTEFIDIIHFYFFEDCLLYQVGSRSYSIDLNSGISRWKIRRENTFDSELTSFNDNYYYLLGEPQDTLTNFDVQIIFKGDAITGEIEQYLIPYFDTTFIPQSLRIGDVTGCIPYNLDDKKYLVVIYQQQTSDIPITFQSYIGLFNIADSSWIYSRKILNDPVANGVLLNDARIYSDKIYMNIGNSIVCSSIQTGEVVWNRDFNHDFLFSGYIIEDNQLLANCENGTFYCINPTTGAIKWELEGAGTSSPLRYLNGIVYFSGGSTGKIHGIDTNTGEYVWLLEPGKYNDAEDFKPDIYVVPGENGKKGKVIICTPEKAYCLPAFR